MSEPTTLDAVIKDLELVLAEIRSIRKPKPMDYYLSDFTFEYVAQTVSNQPNRGLIIYCDELASFFAGFDKYRKGGGDRTRWLSLYDGRSLKSNRKGDDSRIYAKATGISIVGGIQPQVLKQIMESDVACEDGLWSRFTWVRLPLTVTLAPGRGRYDLSGYLRDCTADYPHQQGTHIN